MILLGMWVGIIGYGVLYAGLVKLQGKDYSLAQAFTGVDPATIKPTSGASSSSGATLQSQRQAPYVQQRDFAATQQPINQASGTAA